MKRYNILALDGCIKEDQLGEWVRSEDADDLAARLAAVEAECADLIAGKEYQAMQRTLGEVNARLAEVQAEFAEFKKAAAEAADWGLDRNARLAEAERLLQGLVDFCHKAGFPCDAAEAFLQTPDSADVLCAACGAKSSVYTRVRCDRPDCPAVTVSEVQK